ncbi:hypothetical protein TTHERM_000974320 (macronuclear) [Tetrahymena thermophila SB210]|uniref:Uncharacterized protein n=1 Tax=Tetrahymena thermophila (strain SB210) TaxID=312017 RepID=W7XJT2_TETTS|nr:hypothetical protein TTHERM_000974320 [Tetrahymena thermophila SB210]EWS75921.1 hypothetical protein TTHERM_000974320 [Tetrahymena thermophila SB210]|eukprot:XP_012651546.1 hypothetical protein TTHERM_000974320 [Tetrahymena thermophila SB210]
MFVFTRFLLQISFQNFYYLNNQSQKIQIFNRIIKISSNQIRKINKLHTHTHSHSIHQHFQCIYGSIFFYLYSQIFLDQLIQNIQLFQSKIRSQITSSNQKKLKAPTIEQRKFFNGRIQPCRYWQ